LSDQANENDKDNTAPETEAAHGDFCRDLLRRSDKAVLATIDQADAARPYASLVMIACAPDAAPLLLISQLAEHTQNIARNPNVSLLIDGTAGLENPLTGARVTLQGSLAETGAPGDRQRYVNRHPNAAGYAGFADFAFYRMTLERAHLVAGFGRIHWIAGDSLTFDCAAHAGLIEAEEDILAHMNADHGDAVQGYAALSGEEPGDWVMTGIDPEGLDLRAGGRIARLGFDSPVSDPDGARTALAALAKRARRETA
jgi:putative heme iron utilization protein